MQQPISLEDFIRVCEESPYAGWRLIKRIFRVDFVASLLKPQQSVFEQILAV